MNCESDVVTTNFSWMTPDNSVSSVLAEAGTELRYPGTFLNIEEEISSIMALYDELNIEGEVR